MRSIKTAFAAIALVGLLGCASVRSVALTPIPVDRTREVRAQVDKFIFLFFSFDNDFVDSLKDKLAAKCPGGKVSGILTKHETTSYFIAHKVTITATGYCLGAVPGR